MRIARCGIEGIVLKSPKLRHFCPNKKSPSNQHSDPPRLDAKYCEHVHDLTFDQSVPSQYLLTSFSVSLSYTTGAGFRDFFPG